MYYKFLNITCCSASNLRVKLSKEDMLTAAAASTI